jgi:hypothetical protein
VRCDRREEFDDREDEIDADETEATRTEAAANRITTRSMRVIGTRGSRAAVEEVWLPVK